MVNSGDAAEQIVRMSLEGAEFALKITGSAAKNIAAALYVVLKDQNRTKGKARVESMLREKRPTTIYTVKKEDCPEFARQSKKYGILYAPIPVKKTDDTVDIMVFEDDSARANRIVEKFKLTAVNTASIKSEIEKSREARGTGQAAPEQAAPEKSKDDLLLDELLEKPAQKEKAQPENTRADKTDSFQKSAEKSPPSEPISGSKSRPAKGTSDTPKKSSPQRTSVREDLREIQAQRKQEAEKPKREEKAVPEKKAAQKTAQHKQPTPKKKPKSKER
ncbi:MAG: PcfB family protein [Oscillospiraceae bacterium]|nr:PcfB family protein [Oscillospiraceae bacterium]